MVDRLPTRDDITDIVENIVAFKLDQKAEDEFYEKIEQKVNVSKKKTCVFNVKAGTNDVDEVATVRRWIKALPLTGAIRKAADMAKVNPLDLTNKNIEETRRNIEIEVDFAKAAEAIGESLQEHPEFVAPTRIQDDFPREYWTASAQFNEALYRLRKKFQCKTKIKIHGIELQGRVKTKGGAWYNHFTWTPRPKSWSQGQNKSTSHATAAANGNSIPSDEVLELARTIFCELPKGQKYDMSMTEEYKTKIKEIVKDSAQYVEKFEIEEDGIAVIFRSKKQANDALYIINFEK